MKTYIEPSIEVVDVHVQEVVAGSSGVGTDDDIPSDPNQGMDSPQRRSLDWLNYENM